MRTHSFDIENIPKVITTEQLIKQNEKCNSKFLEIEVTSINSAASYHEN